MTVVRQVFDSRGAHVIDALTGSRLRDFDFPVLCSGRQCRFGQPAVDSVYLAVPNLGEGEEEGYAAFDIAWYMCSLASTTATPAPS